ncbi:proteoglycan 4 [Galendromus occidentalis]|uniref:Proteoglycan 4 n=1 Tax=Galendromus occidentalis TaxID=34638 RepID=A0AAJ7L4H5_9ACAR|nr:proteoglycan 4 [Galendromus occidentalis]
MIWNLVRGGGRDMTSQAHHFITRSPNQLGGPQHVALQPQRNSEPILGNSYKSLYDERHADIRLIRGADGQTCPLIYNNLQLREPPRIPSRPEMPPPTRDVPRIVPLPSRRPPPQPSRPLPPAAVPPSHPVAAQTRFSEIRAQQPVTENKSLHLLASEPSEKMTTATAVPMLPSTPSIRATSGASQNGVTRSPKIQHPMANSQILPARVQEKFVSFDDSVRSYSPDSCATSDTPRSTPDSKSLSRSLSQGARSFQDDMSSSSSSSSSPIAESDKAKASRRLWSFSLPRFKKNNPKTLTDQSTPSLEQRGQTLPRMTSSVEATDERTLPGILKKSASLTSINELEQSRKLSTKSSASQSDLQHALVTSPQNYRDPQTNEEYQRQIVFHTSNEFEKHYVMPPRALRKYIKTNFRRLNNNVQTPTITKAEVQTVLEAVSAEAEPKTETKSPVERDYESGISSGSSATDNESHSSFGNCENLAAVPKITETADPADTPQVVAIKYKPPPCPPEPVSEPLPAPRNRDRFPEPEYINGIQYIKEVGVKEGSISECSGSGSMEKRRRRRSCGSVSSSKSGRTTRRKAPDPRITRRTGVKKYLSQTNFIAAPVSKESKGKYRKGSQGDVKRPERVKEQTSAPSAPAEDKKSTTQLNTSSCSSNFSNNGSGFLHQQLLQLLAENNHLKQINDKLEDQLEQYRRRDEKRDQLLKKYKTMGADEQVLQVRNYLSKLRRLLRSEECHVMIDTVEHFVEERALTLKADRKR